MKVALINPPIVGHTVRGTGKYTQKLYKALLNHNLEIDFIDYDTDQRDYDLIHYPYFDPFFLTLPFIKPKPIVVTIHDLIPLVYPKHFPKGIKGEIKWNLQKLSLKTAKGVITDSHSSKKDIEKFTTFSKERIDVVYLGAGEEFKVISESEILLKTKQKYSLPDEFVLYVGDRNYNKNVENLLKAFQKITEENSKIFLILVGKGLTDLKTPPNFLKLGFISNEELVHLYNLARLYVHPSIAEGFGLPPLEAMACGCPTVISDISSLKEIMAPKSIRINPFKIESIATGIKKVLKFDAKTRQNVVADGLKHAGKFSWEKCAQETIQVYKKYVQ